MRVLQGCKGDQRETKRRAAIEIDSEELKRLKALLEGRTAMTSGKKGGAPSDWYYTYIAIFYRVLATRMLNRRTGAVIWLESCAEHHSTIMYLPWQGPSWRDDAQTVCNDWVASWWSTPSSLRPRALLTSRRVYLLGPYEELRNLPDVLVSRHEKWPGTEFYEYGQEDLGFMEHSDLQMHLERGSLRPGKMPEYIVQDMEATKSLAPNQKLLANFCNRIWRRDQNRLLDATAMEARCTPKRAYEDMVEVHLSDCRIRPDSEIFTLLHYLQQLLIHRFRAEHLAPQCDVGILPCDQWHITPNEAWSDDSEPFSWVDFTQIPAEVAVDRFQRRSDDTASQSAEVEARRARSVSDMLPPRPTRSVPVPEAHAPVPGGCALNDP